MLWKWLQQMQAENKRRIANLTSNILNPFLASLAIILLLSFESASGVFDALRWAFILMAIAILPVFLMTIYLVRRGRLEGILTAIRGQRTVIYLLSLVCSAAGYLVLLFCGAPLMLRAAFATGLAGVVLFTVINLWWKISLHTAMVAALVTVLAILYGWVATAGVLLVLLVAWARLELKQHSPAQVVVGAVLSALIVAAGFYLFGLIEA
jgi:membrane-associated phospholipid phosphatase